MEDLFSNSRFESNEEKQPKKTFEELMSSIDIENTNDSIDNIFYEDINEEFINDSSPKYTLPSNFLDNMNPEQKEAILYDKGSMLVLAGAGSGKTRVITHRFAHLVQKYDLEIHNILCVTFTNKAAGEMKERIGQLLGVSTKNAWIRTFHSMCAMILREHASKIGFSTDFTIYDSSDTKNTVKKIMERLNIDPKQHSDKAISSFISSNKEQLKSPQECEKDARGDFDHICAEVYKEYQATLKSNHAMDFGDLIINTIYLLEQSTEVRERYQRQWRFIMADEFQDTNTPQYRLLSLLTRDKTNVCVVGDDDQSIYAWRGARVENIWRFKEEFQAHVIRLERNYRSYGNILTAANSIVKSIKGRMPKTLKAERDLGEKITYRILEDDRHQAAFVYDEIRKMLSQGKSYSDFAILYRTNAQSRVLEEVLTRHNLPYRIYGGQRFFDRAEIKDILSYLRIIANPFDAEAFDRVVNVPKRKVGDVGKQRIHQYVTTNQCSYIEACLQAEHIDGINKQVIINLINLGKIISELKESMLTVSPTDIVKILIESTRYFEDYLVVEYGSHEAESRFENIQELVNAIKIFEQTNPGLTIADYLREASLLSSLNDEDDAQKDNVISLMTIHSSKGLEFPIVFVIGLAEGVLPLSRTESQEQIDEEKRLLYVAITRAMNKLYLSYEEKTLRYGEFIFNEESHFLASIPSEILDKNHQSNNRREFTHKKSSHYSNNDSYKSNRGYFNYNQKNTSKITSKVVNPLVQEVLSGDLKSIKTEKVSSIKELTENSKVIHQVFGLGVVEYCSEAMIKVSFDRFGTQVLMGKAVLGLKKVVE